jgi:hypothetical protein
MTSGETRTTLSGSRLRTDLGRAGTVTVVAGALGAACAVAVLLTPAMVPTSRFSYPFDTTWFVVSQVLFAVQHLAMLAGVLGLAALAPHPTRLWRPGLVMAGAGLVLLAGCEVFGLTAGSADTESSTAKAVGAAYGLPTVLAGLGFVLCGWVVLRQRLLGWGRGLPLAFGVWVFVVLVPALVGSEVAGRLAIGGWMVLYLLLGMALRRRAT